MSDFQSEGRRVEYQGKVYAVSQEVQFFLEKNQKIQAIKQLRTEYSLGLIEAKKIADLIDFEFKFSTKAKTGWTLQDKLEARRKETEKSKGGVSTLLLRGVQSLIGAIASAESRIEALEKIDAKLTFAPVEECKRLIEMQLDRLTAQSHRIDKLAKEILELKRELEKRPRRRMILKKKEQE